VVVIRWLINNSTILQNANDDVLVSIYLAADNYTEKLTCLRQEQILTNDIYKYPQSVDDRFLSTFSRFMTHWSTFRCLLYQLLKKAGAMEEWTPIITTEGRCQQSNAGTNRLLSCGRSYALFYFLKQEYLTSASSYFKHTRRTDIQRESLGWSLPIFIWRISTRNMSLPNPSCWSLKI